MARKFLENMWAADEYVTEAFS